MRQPSPAEVFGNPFLKYNNTNRGTMISCSFSKSIAFSFSFLFLEKSDNTDISETLPFLFLLFCYRFSYIFSIRKDKMFSKNYKVRNTITERNNKTGYKMKGLEEK
jgi:hypothetical protein